MRDTLQNTYKILGEKKEDISYHDFTYELLKDGGVKSLIIKKYLPLINQMVNKYLQMMDFYINFKLDEEFNETVESPIHEDFSYSSFSEGKRSLVLTFLFSFTWREITRLKKLCKYKPDDSWMRYLIVPLLVLGPKSSQDHQVCGQGLQTSSLSLTRLVWRISSTMS